MPAVEYLKPDGFSALIYSTLRTGEGEEKAKALKAAGASVAKLLSHADNKHGRAITKKQVAQLKKGIEKRLTLMLEGNRREQDKAATQTVFWYSLAFNLPREKAEIANGRIRDLLEDLRFADEADEEEDLARDIEVCPETLTEGKQHRTEREVSVRKPGAEPAQETVTLSPDFARFLREQHGQKGESGGEEMQLVQLLTQGTFKSWLDTENGKDWKKENRLDAVANEAELYRIALSQAFALYESYSYDKLHCRPKNLPMPGIQYGHRILRLPFGITKKCFHDGEPYRGPIDRLHDPDVDLEELVRRYVNALYLEPVTVYNLDDISEDYIESYFKGRAGVLPAGSLSLCQVATKIAVGSQGLSGFLQSGLDQGENLTPENVAAWLQSDDSSDLKEEIAATWASLFGGAGQDSVPGFFESLPTVQDFEKILYGLCVPNVSGDGVGPNDSGSAYFDIPEGSDPFNYVDRPSTPWPGPDGPISVDEKHPEDEDDHPGQSFAAAVLKRIESVVQPYDTVWRSVRELVGTDLLWELDDIDASEDDSEESGPKFSGYEFKATISWLALGAVGSLNQGFFDGSRWEGGSFTGATNADAAGVLRQEIEGWQLLRTEEQVAARLGSSAPLARNAYYSTAHGASSTLRASLPTLIDELVASYRTFMDALLSYTSADSIRSPELEENQTEQVYAQWVAAFTDFLKHRSATRRLSGTRRIALRLAPIIGKYEEVPKPDAGEDGFDRTRILPTHPRMLTEQYMLEPIPAKYACESYPTLYLREDLSLCVRHRGFGIGANLYSTSLLPEEKQVIKVKSFKDTTIKTSESSAENIFEEQTDETSRDFATEMKNESERESTSQSEFNISGKASASWGWGSASIQSGYSSQSGSRSLAKNASNVTNRLASKLSAKRTVSVEMKRTTEKEVELHSELAIEREVKNPNKGHTLTFHWFQMTRKLVTELHLEDLKLVYTDGTHRQLMVFGNGRKPTDLGDVPFRALPVDVGGKLPPDSIVVVCATPYTESIPFSNTNAFLAKAFTDGVAAKISSGLWRILGSCDAAPEGYGVSAFPTTGRSPGTGDSKYVSVVRPDPSSPQDPPAGKNPELAPADEILMVEDEEVFYLPNVDLRYKTEDGIAPSRFPADEFNANSLPRTLLRGEQVINTNGVFCDAMVGQCTALEPYLQRHRDLDLLEKRLEVALKEVDFEWEIARNGLVEVSTSLCETIDGLVEPGAEAFAKRIEEEENRRTRDQETHAQQIALLTAKVNALAKKTETIGQPKEYSVAVPKDTQVTVDLHLPPTGESADVSYGVEVGEVDGGED